MGNFIDTAWAKQTATIIALGTQRTPHRVDTPQTPMTLEERTLLWQQVLASFDETKRQDQS